MTDQGWFHISESASIYPQQGTTLLSNLKSISDSNMLNMPPITESTWVPASVVRLRTTPISGGCQLEPDTTKVSQVIEQRLLTVAVEQKSVQRRDDFLRDQQDFALNHKVSKNYPKSMIRKK